MHDIIKKALDEALTEKYHAELTGCAETDYNFSVGFLADMKALIRKTDNKLIYYSKYIAVAACAVLAVGCAVLLPNLIDSGIDVKPPVTDTATVTGTPEVTTSLSPDSADTIVTTTPAETTTTTPDTMTETTTEESTTTSQSEPAVTDDEVSGTPSEDEVDPETQGGTVTDEEISEDDADEDADIIDGDDDVSEDEDDDAVIEDNDVVIEDSSDDDDVAIEDDDCDVEVDDDASEDDTDSEDDAVIEEDDVVEDDEMDGDDVVIEDEDDAEVDGGDAVKIPLEGATFKEVCEYIISYEGERSNTLEELYLSGIHSKGKTYNLELCDFSFVKDYLISQGSAPVLKEVDIDYGESISIYLTTYEPWYNRNYMDNSPRNKYEDFFEYGIESEEDVEDYDLGESEIEVNVYDSGYISVKAQWFDSETVFFTADSTATTELFDRLDKIGLPDLPSSAGEIVNGLSLTAANMTDGYATIANLYDISLKNVSVRSEKVKQGIVDIFSRGTALSPMGDPPNSAWIINKGISIELGTKDTNTYVHFYVSGYSIIISDGNYAYKVKITEEDLHKLISLICEEAGAAEPVFYRTAAEYLSDKPNFDGLRSFSYYKDGTYYNMYSEEKLTELFEIVKAEMETAVYAPFGSSWAPSSVRLWTTAWDFAIGSGNEIVIYGNRFEASDGFYDRIIAYIVENADEIQAASADVETDDVEEVTDEIDETDDVDIEGEEQWEWEDGDIAVED